MPQTNTFIAFTQPHTTKAGGGTDMSEAAKGHLGKKSDAHIA